MKIQIINLADFIHIPISEGEFIAMMHKWEADIDLIDNETESKYISKLNDGTLILNIWKIQSGDLGGEFIGEHPDRFKLIKK